MSIRIDDIAPDFTVDSTAGQLNLHEWIGDSYQVIDQYEVTFQKVD